MDDDMVDAKNIPVKPRSAPNQHALPHLQTSKLADPSLSSSQSLSNESHDTTRGKHSSDEETLLEASPEVLLQLRQRMGLNPRPPGGSLPFDATDLSGVGSPLSGGSTFSVVLSPTATLKLGLKGGKGVSAADVFPSSNTNVPERSTPLRRRVKKKDKQKRLPSLLQVKALDSWGLPSEEVSEFSGSQSARPHSPSPPVSAESGVMPKVAVPVPPTQERGRAVSPALHFRTRTPSPADPGSPIAMSQTAKELTTPKPPVANANIPQSSSATNVKVAMRSNAKLAKGKGAPGADGKKSSPNKSGSRTLPRPNVSSQKKYHTPKPDTGGPLHSTKQSSGLSAPPATADTKSHCAKDKLEPRKSITQVEAWLSQIASDVVGEPLEPFVDRRPSEQPNEDSPMTQDPDDGEEKELADVSNAPSFGVKPLAKLHIDRTSLSKAGLPKEVVDRVYRALFVYSNGFHDIISEVQKAGKEHGNDLAACIWVTFLHLLECVEESQYKMVMQRVHQWHTNNMKKLYEKHRKEELQFSQEKAKALKDIQELQTTLRTDQILNAETINNLEADLESLKKECSRLSTALAECTAEHEKLKTVHLKMLEKDKHASQTVARQQCQIDQLQEGIAMRDKDLLILQSRLNYMKLEVQEAQALKASCLKQVEATRKAGEKHEIHKAELRQLHTEERTNRIEADRVVAALKQKLEKLDQKLVLEAKLKELADRNNMKNEFVLSNMMKALETFSNYNSSVAAALQSVVQMCMEEGEAEDKDQSKIDNLIEHTVIEQKLLHEAKVARKKMARKKRRSTAHPKHAAADANKVVSFGNVKESNSRNEMKERNFDAGRETSRPTIQSSDSYLTDYSTLTGDEESKAFLAKDEFLAEAIHGVRTKLIAEVWKGVAIQRQAEVEFQQEQMDHLDMKVKMLSQNKFTLLKKLTAGDYVNQSDHIRMLNEVKLSKETALADMESKFMLNEQRLKGDINVLQDTIKSLDKAIEGKDQRIKKIEVDKQILELHIPVLKKKINERIRENEELKQACTIDNKRMSEQKRSITMLTQLLEEEKGLSSQYYSDKEKYKSQVEGLQQEVTDTIFKCEERKVLLKKRIQFEKKEKMLVLKDKALLEQELKTLREEYLRFGMDVNRVITYVNSTVSNIKQLGSEATCNPTLQIQPLSNVGKSSGPSRPPTSENHQEDAKAKSEAIDSSAVKDPRLRDIHKEIAEMHSGFDPNIFKNRSLAFSLSSRAEAYETSNREFQEDSIQLSHFLSPEKQRELHGQGGPEYFEKVDYNDLVSRLRNVRKICRMAQKSRRGEINAENERLEADHRLVIVQQEYHRLEKWWRRQMERVLRQEETRYLSADAMAKELQQKVDSLKIMANSTELRFETLEKKTEMVEQENKRVIQEKVRIKQALAKANNSLEENKVILFANLTEMNEVVVASLGKYLSGIETKLIDVGDLLSEFSRAVPKAEDGVGDLVSRVEIYSNTIKELCSVLGITLKDHESIQSENKELRLRSMQAEEHLWKAIAELEEEETRKNGLQDMAIQVHVDVGFHSRGTQSHVTWLKDNPVLWAGGDRHVKPGANNRGSNHLVAGGLYQPVLDSSFTPSRLKRQVHIEIETPNTESAADISLSQTPSAMGLLIHGMSPRSRDNSETSSSPGKHLRPDHVKNDGNDAENSKSLGIYSTKSETLMSLKDFVGAKRGESPCPQLNVDDEDQESAAVKPKGIQGSLKPKNSSSGQNTPQKKTSSQSKSQQHSGQSTPQKKIPSQSNGQKHLRRKKQGSPRHIKRYQGAEDKNVPEDEMNENIIVHHTTTQISLVKSDDRSVSHDGSSVTTDGFNDPSKPEVPWKVRLGFKSQRSDDQSDSSGDDGPDLGY